MYTVSGSSIESYNDIDHEEVKIEETELGDFRENMEIFLKPHSVNVIQIKKTPMLTRLIGLHDLP